MLIRILMFCLVGSAIIGQTAGYNHPELDWQTFETEHFNIHYYDETEAIAREGAFAAEEIYPHVTELYEYEPQQKTHIIFTDTDDIANGAAYYYDNKIIIWTSPLEFELRGSHRWIQNVITHEFVHIISLQKAMKAGTRFPGAYLQWLGYEDERREDVLYGYPNTIVSYPIPGTAVPPWLAEGSAQVMYKGADWDNWDTHRDMILRDRILNGNMLSLTEMNTFGKRGIGNESVYNAGFAFCQYISVKFGEDALRKTMEALSSPFEFSIESAIEKATGTDGKTVYTQFKNTLEKRYALLTESITKNEREGRIIVPDGTANLWPVWSPDGSSFAYLSNQGKDFFGQTDLYVYFMESAKSERLAEGVISAPAWDEGGTTLYFAKKAKFPNKTGSKYFDLWMYSFLDEEETRLTEDSRAYSAAYIPKDHAVAFLSTKGGNQNIHLLDLASNTIYKVSDFSDHRILSSLEYDETNHRLLFDETINHFRNIRFLSLVDTALGTILGNDAWDERNGTSGQGNRFVYSDDRSGVFNLYMFNESSGENGFITNVTGGAFMPSVNDKGQVLYSMYKNGKYTIALLDSMIIIPDINVGYSTSYFRRNESLSEPMTTQLSETGKSYEDQFPPMFLLPRLTMDYNSLKPGFYFYSSEVLERLSLFGAGSLNPDGDADMFFLFEFNRFYPTLFFETFYITRNRFERGKLDDVRDVDDNLKFRLLQFNWGARMPIKGVASLEVGMTWQQYRAFVKRSLELEHLEAGVAYDYFRGVSGFAQMHLSTVPNRADKNINPSGGYTADIRYDYEKNDFIEGLNLSDAGTLLEEFADNSTHRVSADVSMHAAIPFTDRWTVSIGAMTGWMSNTKADSFFNFFGGGLPGIKGYPFYSIEGNRVIIGDITLRIPVFREKHWAVGPAIIQNSVLGFMYQTGDAWMTSMSDFSLKNSVGIQWRINGYSFYNFPTAISIEMHRGLNTFGWSGRGRNVTYGKENRFYFTMLFGF